MSGLTMDEYFKNAISWLEKIRGREIDEGFFRRRFVLGSKKNEELLDQLEIRGVISKPMKNGKRKVY